MSSELSAFAARHALKSKNSSQKNPGNEKTPTLTDTTETPILKASSAEDAKTQTVVVEEVRPQHRPDLGDETQFSINSESHTKSQEIQVQRPSVALSSYKPNKNNLKYLGSGTLCLKLEPGERLVILGQYEISVRKGQVTLMGSTLQQSSTFYRVFAASSHSLPVIRCSSTEVNSAEVLLRVCSSGINLLEKLSSLFGRLWQDQSDPLGPGYSNLLPKFPRTTFQILFSSKLDLPSNYLQPLVSPPEWNLLLSKLSEPAQKQRVIMVCGPKSSGKSTFTKLLANRLLSVTLENTVTGVGILDLDPGQPEYSPPGQLALVHIQNPNFGPPFSHPVAAGGNKTVRSHSIAAVSPSSDPSLYMSCALDLFSQYRKIGSPTRDCALLINTPGWVFGTGLEILVDLIERIKPSEVIYMSQDGPPEVVETLRESAKSTVFLTLPSQVSEYTTRTAAHLRTMQAMSYFHLVPGCKDDLLWNGQSLTSTPPWQIRYSGDNPGIIGIMCYGEQPPPELLTDTINGSLVAIVVIDDMAAFPEQKVDREEELGNDFDANLRVLEHFHESRLIEEPRILRTTLENIPYFNPANSITLDPQHSHTIGLALVRGIDVARQRIHLLSPISPSVIDEVDGSGKKIVLVSGKLDTPGWAYTEEMNMKMAEEKAAKKEFYDAIDTKNNDELDLNDTNVDGEDAEIKVDEVDSQRQSLFVGHFHDVPWVERLDGSKGRGVYSRVWRVRRDLGREGDGGD
ncbi:RNA processing protein [Diplocarpon rosae]|nr:RNA processing protein [Diplocarpon rosae]